MSSPATVADSLRSALVSRGTDSETLAARTRVPHATVRALLGEPVTVVLPARAYLRGHLGLLAAELRVDRQEMLALFDSEHPLSDSSIESVQIPGIPKAVVAAAWALSGLGIGAIILAFLA